MPWEYDIPEATVERISRYLTALAELERGEFRTASSEEIAQRAGVNAAQVRKDLSYFGELGKRGVGYGIADLRRHLSGVLGVDRQQAFVVVGAGNIGSALAGYAGFIARGFRVVGLFDSSPDKVRQVIHGHPVLPMGRLAEVLQVTGARIAITAVPAEAAQAVVDELVANGVRHILNMAPARVTAPPDVVIRSVDTTTELEVLSFCLQQGRKADEKG